MNGNYVDASLWPVYTSYKKQFVEHQMLYLPNGVCTSFVLPSKAWYFSAISFENSVITGLRHQNHDLLQHDAVCIHFFPLSLWRGPDKP